MKIAYVTLESCALAGGAVVVIDVLRAFTTACFAFEAGSSQIILVGEIEEAFRLRSQEFPEAVLLGELDGLPIEGFDYGNSPAALRGEPLDRRILIQRTSAGTQGVVRSENARLLLAASFVNAQATARFLLGRKESSVTFVITGILGERDGDEDAACADYIKALLLGESPDPLPFLNRVKASYSGQLFSNPDLPEYPVDDLMCALDVNRYDFCLLVQREDGRLVMKPVWVS